MCGVVQKAALRTAVLVVNTISVAVIDCTLNLRECLTVRVVSPALTVCMGAANSLFALYAEFTFAL